LKVGYYPGCSLSGTGKEYDMSLRKVAGLLETELEELKDWSCCGATSAHATNHLLSVALPARNLVIAKHQKLEEMVAPCAACYNRMMVTAHELKSKPEIERQVTDLLGESAVSDISIINIIELFQKIGKEKVAGKVKVDLKGIKAACYYGCLLVRPFAITNFDDAEQPESMEEIIKWTGAQPVDWNYKIECCGGAHSIAHKKIVVDLSKKILDDAKLHGADVVIVACPMCHSNLDMRQVAIKKAYPAHQEIPVLYLSEFVGLALGLNPKELGLNCHLIDTKSLLEKAEIKG
jgi:heterodisulfide reductase subunit B2